MCKKMIVISGLSGSGKTTLIQELIRRHPVYEHAISFTTRKRKDDSDPYYFVNAEAFGEMIRNQELIEYTRYASGDFYGTAAAELRRIEKHGRIPVLDIDADGYRQILANPQIDYAGITSLFLLPPNAAKLAERLKSRNTETPETMIRRLENAVSELNQIRMYDAVIINQSIPDSVRKISCAIRYTGPGDRYSAELLKKEILRLIAKMKETGGSDV